MVAHVRFGTVLHRHKHIYTVVSIHDGGGDENVCLITWKTSLHALSTGKQRGMTEHLGASVEQHCSTQSINQ